MGHRVAPDPLVDLLALEHLAALLGEQVEQLELAAGEVEGLLADEGLEAVGPDLHLADGERRGLVLLAAAAAAAGDRFDPGDRLLGMARLGHPVVDAEPQAAHPLGDGGAAGDDDQAEVGQHRGDPFEVGPGFVAQHGRVDEERIQLHRHQVARRHGAGLLAEMPTGRLSAAGEDGDETAVGVEDGDSDRGSVWALGT